MTAQAAAYGFWRTPLDIGDLFAVSAEPMYPFRVGSELYWLQALPNEAGRVILMQQAADTTQTITPPPYDLRTTVHEYGGRCFVIVNNDEIIFNHRQDGRLYRQSLHRRIEPVALTAGCFEGKPTQFADLQVSQDGRWLLAVVELTRPDDDNENFLVSIDLGSSSSNLISVLKRGADFYAMPVIAPDNCHLAWIEWQHPNMPWDQTSLKLASIDSDSDQLSIVSVSSIAAQDNQSICQIGFLDSDGLIYIADSDHEDARGFWNLYRYNLKTESYQMITQDQSEYGETHWIFGQSRWLALPGGRVAAIRTAQDNDQIMLLDTTTGRQAVLAEAACCRHLFYSAQNPDELLLVGHSRLRPAQIIAVDLPTCQQNSLQSNPLVLEANQVSTAQSMQYPTRDGEHAFANYYAPCNPAVCAPTDSKPPLLVMVHGGPSARADSGFALIKQFFTSHGFAIVDVNHRGSSGYGRRYRQSLLGRWGDIDADDIADAVQYLISTEQVNPRLVFIRGGSAGGYAVLRSLTRYPDLFAAGACYYGIGNLITLATMTHKFEAYYTDQLVGETYHPERVQSPQSSYHQRSPIFALDRLRSPIILFQGLDDKVVPPALSREVVAQLKANGVAYEYHEYQGEGHGFRRANTRIDALSREIAFYQAVMQTDLEIS